MGPIRGVLLDFSDTLFWRDGADRAEAIAHAMGASPAYDDLAVAWRAVKVESTTPDELSKRRDSSAEAHRACWVALLAPFEDLHPGLAVAIYDDQPDPLGWHAFSDTAALLHGLLSRGVPVAVVSDIGWDIRPVFEHHGVASCVQSWVLSYEHGTEKPDPALFRYACESISVEPAQALMVGDSLSKDGGAAAVGIRSLVLPAWSGEGDRGLRIVLDLAVSWRGA